MRIRLPCQVSEYVKERILALRRAHPGQYGNAACVRTNAMKARLISDCSPAGLAASLAG